MTSGPQRIQRKRTRGWRMPENTVYVGRPARFANPYRVVRAPRFRSIPAHWMVQNETTTWYPSSKRVAVRFAVWMHRRHAINPFTLRRHDNFDALRGKNLACWCAPDQPCHADVLLKIANS